MPSWLNEKGPAVSVSRATWLSCIISGVMFLILGFGGASNLDFSSADLLAVMNGSGISAAAKVAAYIFPSAALLSGIPVVSVGSGTGPPRSRSQPRHTADPSPHTHTRRSSSVTTY